MYILLRYYIIINIIQYVELFHNFNTNNYELLIKIRYRLNPYIATVDNLSYATYFIYSYIYLYMLI